MSGAGNSLVDRVGWYARSRPNATAPINGASGVSCLDLWDGGQCVATGLPERGPHRDDRVVTAVRPSTPFVTIFLAAMFAGRRAPRAAALDPPVTAASSLSRTADG